MPDLHADYLAVPEARRWGGPLNQLYPTLRKEAWKLEGAWAWRVLPHGALVSVRIVPPAEAKLAFHTEVRIARKDPPKDEAGWRKWAAELAVFLKHLTGEDDVWEALPVEPGKADARFRFLMQGERTKPKCSRCGSPEVAQPGIYKADLCNKCALELGTEETTQRELL